MTDARFPERWILDRRFQRVAAEGRFWPYMVSLAWSASNRTDGLILPDDLAVIPFVSEGDAEAFVRNEVWNRRKIGWLIVDYESTQTSADSLIACEEARAARREKDAARKRAERAAERAKKLAETGQSAPDSPPDSPDNASSDGVEEVSADSPPGSVSETSARKTQGQGQGLGQEGKASSAEKNGQSPDDAERVADYRKWVAQDDDFNPADHEAKIRANVARGYDQ